jgi:hypothetical protein
MILSTLFLNILLFYSCVTSHINQDKVLMRLSVDSENFSPSNDTVKLTATIFNNSSEKVNILNFPDFSTDVRNIFYLLIEKDSRVKLSTDNFFDRKRLPRKSDYIKLVAGDSLTLNYNLRLSSLVDDYKELTKQNDDFGEYAIHVKFNDEYLLKKNAVKTLISNTVIVQYTNY